jgi:hypothetical protein
MISEIVTTQGIQKVSSVSVDNFTKMIGVVIENGLSVEKIEMTIENAIDIGFLDFSAIAKHYKL